MDRGVEALETQELVGKKLVVVLLSRILSTPDVYIDSHMKSIRSTFTLGSEADVCNFHAHKNITAKEDRLGLLEIQLLPIFLFTA